MIRLATSKRYSPIGIDVGASSIKMVQLTGDHTQLVDAARWDFPPGKGIQLTHRNGATELAESIARMRQGRIFRGNEIVICLGNQELFLQNVRVPRVAGSDLDRMVQQEAASRLPFPAAEAELRYIEADDVRQGEAILREVILLAAHRPRLEEFVETFVQAGLQPLAVDVEPCAVLRGFVHQFRRDEDRQARVVYAHIGYCRSAVIISEGDAILFVKYIESGGKQMDEAVARSLKMELDEAVALRRHNGDRRTSQQDPEVAKTVAEAVRPAIERLASELAMCIRYHSVTFRGNPITRLIVTGGEATPLLVDRLNERLDVNCEAGDPLRSFNCELPPVRRGQWDVATGLALRDVEG